MRVISILAEAQSTGAAEGVAGQADYDLAIAVLGALGIGGVVGTWLGQSQDRRTARAEFVKTIHRMEAQRHQWLKHDEVRAAMAELRTQALVANAPKTLVDEYLTLALVSAWKFDVALQISGGDDYTSIDQSLQEATLNAAELLIFAAWHPWLARARMPITRRRMAVAKSRLSPELAETLRSTASGRGLYTAF